MSSSSDGTFSRMKAAPDSLTERLSRLYAPVYRLSIPAIKNCEKQKGNTEAFSSCIHTEIQKNFDQLPKKTQSEIRRLEKLIAGFHQTSATSKSAVAAMTTTTNTSGCGTGIQLTAKVLLTGAHDQGVQVGSGYNGTGYMRDNLRSLGLLPTSEPYSGSNYNYPYVGTCGNGATAPNILAVPANQYDAIVDWVIVELRNSAFPEQVVYSRPALVQRDADIVDLDKVSPVKFNIAAGNYYVAIRHRNHLGVMTGSSRSISNTPIHIDFTRLPWVENAYGVDAQKSWMKCK
ncbi:MAG: hypothetical protein JNN12_01340 [Bacteroidetes Order II. Incertae sedis bacterium]|nr:hypothetical protein [Bacteroidetes Order II. bacterium]